ncbi:MAG TPA: penicillin-binding protein activator LpoB [Planctomycetota bacterium]|nr:penicillin-binding protein activator LpoB [Planctomycetota bacterium]
MKILLLALCVPALLPSCRSRPKVRYEDPTGVETLTVDFGSTDLQKIAADLLQSMLRHEAFNAPEKPVLFVGAVENATSEHVDTRNVTDSIRTALLKSGKVKIAADPQGRGEIGDQTDYQRSGAVSPETAAAIGRQVGAGHVLYGRLTSIDKKSGGAQDLFFKFTLNLVNVENGLFEWADEVQIRKVAARRSFGW